MNKLSVNTEKTNYLIFKPKNRQCNSDLSIVICDLSINRVKQIKHLGIIIEENLSWKKHIDFISLKISKSIGIINRTKHKLNSKSMITLYYSLIYPYLTYANIIWGNQELTYLNKLRILQKKSN
jgi:hypothetical protein